MLESKSRHTITAHDLIAALPVHQHTPDDYLVFYVEPNPPAKESGKESPVIFKSLVATKLPSSAVHSLQPPGNACWQLRQDDGSMPNLHIIISTGSGTGKAESVYKSLLRPMLKQICPGNDKYSLHYTTSEQTVTDLAREVFLPQANNGVSQAIILLSGDGGLVDIVNGLLSGKHLRQYRRPNITLLPVGTGNAMAHSADITADNTLGLKTLLHGVQKDLPIFQARFSSDARYLVNEAREERDLQLVDGVPTVYGAVVGSWGFHATLVADSDTAEYRKFGAERFKMAAKEALYPADGSAPHAYRGKVSILQRSASGKCEWRLIERETHAYILATPVRQLEKGFTISPASRPLDGKLWLVHFGDVRAQGTMDLMTKAYGGGTHVEDERVGYEEIEGLLIEFGEEDARWRRVCIDGKIIRVEKGGRLELRKSASDVADLIVMER